MYLSRQVIRSSRIPLICIVFGLIMFIAGIMWDLFDISRIYGDISDGGTTQPYWIIMSYLTYFGTILIIFGIAFSIYTY